MGVSDESIIDSFLKAQGRSRSKGNLRFGLKRQIGKFMMERYHWYQTDYDPDQKLELVTRLESKLRSRWAKKGAKTKRKNKEKRELAEAEARQLSFNFDF